MAEKATTRDLETAITTHGHDINLTIDLGQINHTHVAADITDLADYISTGGSVDFSEIEQKITDLQTAVATKANTNDVDILFDTVDDLTKTHVNDITDLEERLEQEITDLETTVDTRQIKSIVIPWPISQVLRHI